MEQLITAERMLPRYVAHVAGSDNWLAAGVATAATPSGHARGSRSAYGARARADGRRCHEQARQHSHIGCGSRPVAADVSIAVRIDAESGTITTGDLSNPEVDDIFDDLGEVVLRTDGEVIIVPAERMPTSSGAAAMTTAPGNPS